MEISVNFDIYYPKFYMLKNYFEIINNIGDEESDLEEKEEKQDLKNKSDIDEHYGIFL